MIDHPVWQGFFSRFNIYNIFHDDDKGINSTREIHGTANCMCFFFFDGEPSWTSRGSSKRTRFNDGGVLRAGIFNMMEPGGGWTISGARSMKGMSTADTNADDSGS